MIGGKYETEVIKNKKGSKCPVSKGFKEGRNLTLIHISGIIIS